MRNDGMRKWEHSFRVVAQADECSVLRRHLGWLDLPDKPRLLLEPRQR